MFSLAFSSHSLYHNHWQISVLEHANSGVMLFLHAMSAKQKHPSDANIAINVYFMPFEHLGNKKLSSDVIHFVDQHKNCAATPGSFFVEVSI